MLYQKVRLKGPYQYTTDKEHLVSTHHNSSYDAGLSNRFGVEQAQPLIAAPVKSNTPYKQLLSLEGNKDVSISILKTTVLGIQSR